MSSEEDVLKRLDSLEATNKELRKLTMVLFQSNVANHQNYEDLSRNVVESLIPYLTESLVPYFAKEMDALSKNHADELKSQNEHYKEKLNQHQTFWTAFSAALLTVVMGAFFLMENAQVQNTMTLHATHIQEIFSQEKEKIDVVLNGFKEKLHTHHK